MTYLLQRSRGNVAWAKDVHASAEGWVTPGGYLRKSMLRIIAKQFCGNDIPTEMLETYEKVTFPDDEAPSQELELEMRAERSILNLKKLSLSPRRSCPSAYDSDEDHDAVDGSD